MITNENDNTWYAPVGYHKTIRQLVASSGVTGLLLWAYPVMYALIARRRSLSDSSSVDGSALIQVLFVIICFLSVIPNVIGGRSWVKVLLFKPPLVFLFVYIILCLMSSLWSNDPAYGGYRAFECLVYLLLIVQSMSNLYIHGGEEDMVEWLMVWTLWCLFWGIFTSVKMLGLSWVGGMHLFRTGSLFIGPVLFIGLFISRRRIASFILMMFALFSGANKTYIGFSLGLLPAMASGSNLAKKLIWLLLGAVITVPLIFGIEETLSKTLWRGQGGVGMEYTTGRDKIWRVCLPHGMKQPFMGYGFVIGENELLFEHFNGAISTHSVLLSSFLAIGISGPVLMGLLFLSAFMRVLRTSIAPHWRSGLLGALIMSFIISNTAPGLGGRAYGSWIAVVLVITLIAVATERWGVTNAIPFSGTPFSPRQYHR